MRRQTSLRMMAAVFCAASAGQAAPNDWKSLFAVQTPATQSLRGYGQVETRFEGLQSGTTQVWVGTFRCENEAKANTVIGKFLADLTLSPNVTSIRLAGLPAVQVAGGGVFLGCVEGSTGRLLCADSAADLQALLKTRPELGHGAVEKAAYPVYLDRFDRYGWGFYGLDGYRNTHDWMGLAAKLDGKPGLKDPKEDFDWLVKLNNRFEPHLDANARAGDADGIIANADDEWTQKLAKENNLPVSFRVYGSVNSDYHGWALRRFGEFQNQPADFLTPRVGSYAVEMMQSWYAEDAHRYQAVKAAEMVRKYTNEPNILGWMHPYGEIQVGTWEYDQGDYGPNARNSWHRYLQAKGVDLAGATRLYGRGSAFGDWDQVPVPEFATFAGLDGQVLSLGGNWWCRPEVSVDQPVDDAWWQQAPEERYRGMKEKWWEGTPSEPDWKLVPAPGGGGLPNRSSSTCTNWYRRSFPLTQEQLKRSPLYLYWFPISHESVHSGAHKAYHEVYINGSLAGAIGSWGALDVSKYLVAGENQIALHLRGSLWQGRIFLSTEAPAVFPGLGEGKNQLWLLWRSWLLDEPIAAMSTVFDGMRQADPNRPIKIMAPIRLGSSRYLRMAADYGAFPHFTGEGMWYFPWYKRYAYLYDIPGSSETAGPARSDDPKCSDQFASFRRVFLAGLNAHDPVFMAQTYSRSPYLRPWWESHQPVLHQLGRYDLFGPQVLLFRSNLTDSSVTPSSPYPEAGQSSRYVQKAWDWDLGRGTLQTLGQSYLYIDEMGLGDGKMNGYKVMIDGGNEIMSSDARDRIAAWVRTGGTFVALPFSGRSSLTAQDDWPVRGLTGCEIGKFRQPGQGSVTIGAHQSVFKTTAGRKFPDNGSSMDWVGNELNKYSVELKPGPDCEVLATYENGEPAVVRHRMGQGSVITFGSAFWRSSRDIQGLWWPKAPETEVIGDLLAGLGQLPLCETDGNLVWPQPYRSNNGLDRVTVLVSWNEEKDVTSTLRMRLPSKPAALVSFGVDGQKELPFTWKDGIAETRVAMPAREVKVVRAVGIERPFDALSYWWGYQQRLWHATVKPTLDMTPYTKGKFADPTVDLRPGARFTNRPPVDTKWLQPEFEDKDWTESPLGPFRFWGAEPGKPLWVRKTFQVPPEWLKRSGQLRIVVFGGSGPWVDSPKLWLNGVPIEQIGSDFVDNTVNVEARKFLRDGQNCLAWEFPGKQQVQAIQGEVYLYFRPEPVRSIPLVTGKQSIFIPKAWEGKYRVTLYLEGARYTISNAGINGHTLARARPYPAPAEYNLLAYLKYGADNVITIDPGKAPGDVKISRMDLFPLDESYR